MTGFGGRWRTDGAHPPPVASSVGRRHHRRDAEDDRTVSGTSPSRVSPRAVAGDVEEPGVRACATARQTFRLPRAIFSGRPPVVGTIPQDEPPKICRRRRQRVFNRRKVCSAHGSFTFTARFRRRKVHGVSVSRV